MRKKTLAASLAAVGAIATTLVVTATPASAASNLALYWNQNYRGSVYITSSSDSNLDDGLQAGDEASSVHNGTTVAWVLFDDAGYADRRYCIRPGQRVANLHAQAWNFGDKISSVRRLGTASCSGYPQF
jgi:hypothetical protein